MRDAHWRTRELCLGVVSVKEKDISVGNQLRENNKDGQIPGVSRE